MYAYYNDSDEYVCEWTRNLVRAKLIPDGVVDSRSIREVQPEDLREFTQVHLFSGIAGWAHALSLAGWPDDWPVWTGSCPCQPFSGAGKHKGYADDRHLWPDMYRLVSECRPPIVFGEQVASKLGREWLYGVRSDLESSGYAVGAADLPAAGVGAPHIRQRLYWMAHPHGQRLEGRRLRPDDNTHQISPWSDGVDYFQCSEGRKRPAKPDVWPLADGVPGRVGRIRAYGNAIVPQVAAVFIRSAVEAVR